MSSSWTAWHGGTSTTNWKTWSLTPIQAIGARVAAWRETSGRNIAFHKFDVAENYHRLLTLIAEAKPDAIVHFAEQRAAPYSMKSSFHKRYTVNNNLNATNNLLAAVVESGIDTHVVHLGTMGVYGYGAAGMPIPEGYLPIKMDGADGAVIRREILFPADPGSIYHLTKRRTNCYSPFTTRTTACESRTFTRASSGARRSMRRNATNG
jgi:UDP-sulfoquinovose synthase